ncbi:MAG: sigma-70 family RNA polymerase sigma factor [Kiritimatiellia bacterium]|jgi:RNA polymerase sigma factor (sigma-70 family)|nr:sigma-70 family RNA polymerase sigma factor [Kiritimatiellia bacterium]MDP6848144.1 sigma-70 family RNA polymerase sigma factor [Kiritimatiellia bacterium]
MFEEDLLYDRYMNDIVHFERITPKREQELSKTILTSRSHKRIEKAVNELVQANLLLVVHCLKDFSKYLESPGARITHMDLIAEGNIGLMKAARNFDARHGSEDAEKRTSRIRFSTYACKSIKNAMRRALKLSRFIHIPEHHFSYWGKIKAMEEEHGETLTNDMLQKDLGVGAAKLGMLKQSQNSATALLDDLPQESGGAWSDFMEDKNCMNPRSEVERSDLRGYLEKEIQHLPERTQRMVTMMYLDPERTTFADLSKIFGVSKERCRQVCAQGLKALRLRVEAKWDRIGGREVYGKETSRKTVRKETWSELEHKLLTMPLTALGYSDSDSGETSANVNAA